MKIRHLYSFFADVYASFRSRTVFFVRNYSFCNIRQRDKSCFTCNIRPNKRALFPFFKTSNNSALQTTIKQARFYKPCIYDKQLGFNKPAVVIADSLFAVFRHLCFNGCLCDMPHPFKVGFRNKHTANRRRSPINKRLSKIIVFTIRQRKIIRPQTTRKNIICILHPFHVQNHNKRAYANS